MAKLASFTRDELIALLAQAWEVNVDHWLMILTAFSHGLRVSEVVNVKACDIEGGYLTVKRLKGSLKTTQPLVSNTDPLLNEKPWLESLVRELKFKGLDKARLFPMSRVHAWRLIQKYGLAAGIPKHKCHPHALKHTIAKFSIKAAGIENVRQYLGHKSIASTGEYLKVSDDEAASAITASIGAAK